MSKKKKRSVRRKSSGTRDDDSAIVPEDVPEDLLIEILKRLPVKSLCRFRCVSTPWRSLISAPRLIDPHLAHSATRPKLIVSFPARGGIRFFSADQSKPRNDQRLIARPFFSLRGRTGPFISQSHDGLICLEVDGEVNICNPSTRKYGTLRSPTPTTRSAPNARFLRSHCFGFDPVERKHKVLITQWERPDQELIMEPCVLTLGTNEWRRVEGCAPHFKMGREVCFDGVVYYTAWMSAPGLSLRNCLMVFNVRTESFRMIKIPDGAHEVQYGEVLIKFKGRIAMADRDNALSGDEIVMWILEDLDQEIWKKRVFVLPPCWKEMVGDREVFPAGTVGSGELLFAPRTLSKPVCLFYYNLETNGFRRSKIGGLPERKLSTYIGYDAYDGVLTFSDHVESLLPLPLRGLSSRN